MKRWLVLAVAAIAIAGFTTVSFAAINGSHHDMAAFRGLANTDACYACHGIRGADTTNQPLLGSVGTLCYTRCHIGSGSAGDITTFAGQMPEYGTYDNASRTLVPVTSYGGTILGKYIGGHKMAKGSLPDPDAFGSITAAAAGWPYMDCAVGSMQCTSCHDVHSNSNAPFIRAPLSTGTPDTSFCEQCHTATADGAARYTTVAGSVNGAHPTEIDYSGAAGRTSNTRHGRTILLKDVFSSTDNSAVFRNVSPFSQTSLNDEALHYNPGGKLGVDCTTAYTPSTGGRVGCYTCHAIHQPMGDMSGLPQVSQLIVSAYKNVNSVSSFAESDLCIGCHGGANAPAVVPAASIADNNCVANPGVTSYYHPVDGDSRPVSFTDLSNSQWKVSTTSGFIITVNINNGGVPVPVSDNTAGRLLCASCHTTSETANGVWTTTSGVHAGPAGTMLLNPSKPTCESCHNTTAANNGLTANSHHVYGDGANAGPRFVGYGYPTSVTYNATFTANLQDGLQCNDCHVFNATAHNWN